MNRTTESSISDCDHHPKVKLKTTSDERNKNSSKEDGELSDTITIDSDCELIEKPAPPQVIISDSEDDVIDFCDADYEKSLLTGSGIRGILVQQSNGKRHRNKSDGVESPPSRVWVPLAMENPQNFMKHENNFTGETNQLSVCTMYLVPTLQTHFDLIQDCPPFSCFTRTQHNTHFHMSYRQKYITSLTHILLLHLRVFCKEKPNKIIFL